MEMKFGKLWPLIVAVCLSITCSAFAQSNYQSSSSGSTYGSNADSSSSSQSGQGTYQRGTFREITPPAGPRVAHGADVFITADFIWWKATQDGLDYAATGLGPINPPTNAFTNVSKGRIATVGEDWAPGFKVGLGLNLGHDGWDIYLQYTWLHASDRNSISGDLVAMDVPNTNNAHGTAGSGRWGLHFNALDLELGRNFYLSQFLTLRPFIGLKGTWQDHDWKSKLSGGGQFSLPNAAGTVPVTGPYRKRVRQDTWGVGVRSGFNAAWYMSKSWSIYGDLAWTAMMTRYDVDRKDKLNDTTTGTTTVVVNIDNNNFYTVRYIGELELGLRWEIWFYDDNYHFAIQAGWEEQVWLNWTKKPMPLSQTSYDLSFHGLNLKFRFDF